MTAKPHAEAMVSMGFEAATRVINIAEIQPLRIVAAQVKKSAKYRQMCASIREVGIIEPPLVARSRAGKLPYVLVSGHLRLEALKDMGVNEVECLIATDDEAFTPNKYINPLATIQQARMIQRSIDKGLSPQRIAKAFNIDVASLKENVRVLTGICMEAQELLKDKHVPRMTFKILQKMAPLRQIEAAELMIAMNNYTHSCATWLLAATPQAQLVETEKPKKMRGLTSEQIGMIEREASNLDRQFKMIEQSFGSDHLELTLARTFLSNLLSNARIVRYLAQHQTDIFREFQKLVDAEKDAA